ncbi:hypothetical protein [Gorillibacterium sp. sgz5001074]|uniref:hypothetical protein n=1 Tax=Gorillibacterium sp. sgz5001074 TaxID=3446695 RepID=UPI003F663CD0
MKKTMIIASCILGMSMIAGSLILSREAGSPIRGREENPMMTEKQLSEYLHVSNADLQKIIAEDQTKRVELRRSNGSWDTYSMIPYAAIGETKVFMKDEVDQWVKYRSFHHDP